MSNILKLIQLDKALLKPYYKYFLIIIICTVPIMFGYKDIISSMVFAIIMISVTSSYTFSVAEKNDLNRLYGLLPVSKNDIVTGRYIFTALIGLVGMLISLILNLIILTIVKVPFTLDEVILSIDVGMILYFLFTAIQLPGFFKFGALKGRAFTFIPLVGLLLMSSIVKSLSPNLASNANTPALLNNPLGMLMIAILLSVVLYGISIGITQRIYDRMEL